MSYHRRELLRLGVSAVAALSFEPFDAFRRRAELRASETRSSGYGPLRPVRDEATGLELIMLPEGFRYTSFGWTGDPIEKGRVTPPQHDGMAAVSQEGDIVTLIRNHEVSEPSSSIADEGRTYDKEAGGGCTRILFDVKQAKLLSTSTLLGGTQKNCAGGLTPWGTWLTCEETVDAAHGMFEGKRLPFEKDHGYIFEVPPTGDVIPEPLTAMGRFVHEAIAIDPATGIVYETEDRDTAGFYRFLPDVPGQLARGGKLQMMKVVGRPDVRTNLKADAPLSVSWVDIDDPLRAHSENKSDAAGVFQQGKKSGATTFARLEGCWYGAGKIFFVSTSGGDKRLGQIFEYDPKAERLRLIFESHDSRLLEYPDNITFSPRGGLVLCEDGDKKVERLCGLTVDGQLFHFAENHVRLNGEKNGFYGDFTKQEWCGACFSPDGTWLFANIQTPGFTVAITGPWERGIL